MDVPFEISFREMESSPALESLIRERAEKLRRFGRMTSCRVAVSAPHRHRRKGKLFQVTVEIGVPGHPELVVSREPAANDLHEDAYQAVRDAFDKAERRLQDLTEKRDDTEKSGPKG